MEKKKPIIELQEFLRNIALVNKKYPLIIPDGIYGKATKEAVRLFQEDNFLLPTGEADFATWESLKCEAERCCHLRNEPYQIVPVGEDALPLKLHDESPLVEVLERMLDFCLRDLDDFKSLSFRGYYDDNTKHDVKLWQKICRIKETGEVDKETWNLLSFYYLILIKRS